MSETRTAGVPVTLHEPMHMHPAAVLAAERQFALTGQPVAHARRGADAFAFAGLDTPRQREGEPFVRLGNTAVVAVDGPVMSGGCCWWLGTSPHAIVAGLDAALEDDSVEAVAMDFDSPGGTVAGLDTLVDAIDRVNAVKPVHAFVHEMACSLGYLMAARCTKVWATPSSTSGSIGSLYAVEDSARAAEKHGVTVHYITSGAPHKKTNRPGAAADPEMLEHWQAQVDAMGAQFRAFVAEKRPALTEARMLEMGGAAFYGSAQLDRGLVDELVGARAFYELAATGALAATPGTPTPTAAPRTTPTPEPAASRGATQEAVMATVDELKDQYENMTDEDKEAFKAAITEGEEPESETEEEEPAAETEEEETPAAETEEEEKPAASASARVTIAQAEAMLNKYKLPAHTVNALALESQKKQWDKTDLLEAALAASRDSADAPSGQPAPLGGGRPDKSGQAGTAKAEAEAAVAAAMKANPDLTSAKAHHKVYRENPALHRRLIDEANTAAG